VGKIAKKNSFSKFGT